MNTHQIKAKIIKLFKQVSVHWTQLSQVKFQSNPKHLKKKSNRFDSFFVLQNCDRFGYSSSWLVLGHTYNVKYIVHIRYAYAYINICDEYILMAWNRFRSYATTMLYV